MEVSGQVHAHIVLTLGKESPYPLNRRLENPRVSVDAAEKRKI
jgi:hypothetical protein